MLLGTMALAPSVLGLQVTVYQGPFQVNPGGEFVAKPSDGLTVPAGYAATTKDQGTAAQNPSFQTFCLERSEVLVFGTTYDVTLSNSAKLGGGGAVGGKDPISVGTAYLYDQFARGVLSGYDFADSTPGVSRKADAEILQQTIWYLEEEIGIGGVSDTKFLDLVAGTTDNKSDAAPGAYGVAVMTLKDGALNRQDLLIRVPDGGLTIMLLGMSLLLIPGTRRLLNPAS